jgi:hypothetical protein
MSRASKWEFGAFSPFRLDHFVSYDMVRGREGVDGQRLDSGHRPQRNVKFPITVADRVRHRCGF